MVASYAAVDPWFKTTSTTLQGVYLSLQSVEAIVKIICKLLRGEFPSELNLLFNVISVLELKMFF